MAIEKCSKPCTFDQNQAKSINTIDPPVSNIPLSEAISLPKIPDKISGVMFLLDTGDYSNFLRDSDANKEETHSQFFTANGTPIKCFEKTDLETDIGFGKTTATFSYVR